MSEPEQTNEPTEGRSELSGLVSGGKPTPAQFVILQANITLRTLVDYESQYTNSPPKDIQSRILAMADFIKRRLDEYDR